jgi:D-alanyl-lipoteichoic acid acyltransferase DltB (MBOAT superfamily)
VLFNSLTFAIFFVLFFPLYWAAARRLRVQNALVLAASYLFYGWWDERYLILLIVTTVTDFIGGLGASGRPVEWKYPLKALSLAWLASLAALSISLRESAWILLWLAGFSVLVIAVVAIARGQPMERRRKIFVASAITVNLGVLGFFKYFNFFAEQFATAMGSLGLSVHPFILEVVLPVGISFYTFQSMSYTIDNYRKQMQPTDRLLEFAAYASFFPQLVAGPIERATRLLPQFSVQKKFSWEAVRSGAWLFTWGLYKKLVIADNISPIANQIFATPQDYASTDLVVGLLAFAFQIYCDFSGYSDMARGLARTLGFEISINFRQPYFARTPSEFWQGWHISLSTWLRDYLYIPLGGNRHGELMTYRNLTITMLLGGLWHGAKWTFVAWGAYQGLILVIYRLLRVDDWLPKRDSREPADIAVNFVAWLVMFCLVLLGWLFFRAVDMTAVAACYRGMAQLSVGGGALWGTLFAYIAPLIVVEMVQKFTGELELLTRVPRLNHGIVSLTLKALMIYGLVFLSAEGGQQFIYFDF